ALHRRREPSANREQRDEHDYHTSNPGNRHGGRTEAGGNGSEGQSHDRRHLPERSHIQTLRSASGILSRIAPSAGAAPARRPIAPANITPSMTSRNRRMNTGNKPRVGSPCWTNSQAVVSPSPPATSTIDRDSASTSARIRRSE